MAMAKLIDRDSGEKVEIFDPLAVPNSCAFATYEYAWLALVGREDEALVERDQGSGVHPNIVVRFASKMQVRNSRSVSSVLMISRSRLRYKTACGFVRDILEVFRE